MEISEYTRCYLSELGHNNFIYPSSSSALLSRDCELVSLSWVGGGSEGLRAVKVLKSCLMPLQIDKTTRNSSSPPSKDEYTVVWVPENLLGQSS